MANAPRRNPDFYVVVGGPSPGVYRSWFGIDGARAASQGPAARAGARVRGFDRSEVGQASAFASALGADLHADAPTDAHSPT